MKQVINNEFLNKSIKDYEKCCKHNIIRHALSNISLTDLCKHKDNSFNDNFAFSIDIPTMSCANQKSTGRCWIFAGLNVLREKIAKECKIKEFELSQSYVAFYDKLEKINYKLEKIIELLGYGHDDRTLSFLLSGGIEDGGQWDMFVNVVKKYGLVPKNVMDETYMSSNTGELNRLLNVELRKFAAKANELYSLNKTDEIYPLKEELLSKCYHLLIDCYGKPIKEFNFEYVDKDNNYHCDKGFTPLSFFDKYIGKKIDDYVSLINAPTNDKPFYQTYTIKHLGNVVGGKDIIHLNLPMERFKELVLNQLKDKDVVWFGCDCGKYADRVNSIWDIDSFDYQTPFGLDYNTEKAIALDFGISAMDHAMVFTGVNLDENIPTKWKVENSWGTDKPNKGYYVMNDSWFDRYVYQAVVDKKYLNEKELKCYEQEVNILKPWDPMGTLAK